MSHSLLTISKGPILDVTVQDHYLLYYFTINDFNNHSCDNGLYYIHYHIYDIVMSPAFNVTPNADNLLSQEHSKRESLLFRRGSVLLQRTG